jgi:hypothetical protein
MPLHFAIFHSPFLTTQRRPTMIASLRANKRTHVS